MFQKNVQWFVDRLVERMLPTVGSFISSALQRMLILNHAEHHNQLEEQALRYEAAGRTEIADLIRKQAQELSLDKPLPHAKSILSDFDADNPALFESATAPIALPEVKKRRSRRRNSRAIEQNNDEGGARDA